MTPAVSIVVPTRNGIETLPALVDAVNRQTDRASRELVVVDSGSTDGTREYVARVADLVIDIAPQAFNHGTARNTGVASARVAWRWSSSSGSCIRGKATRSS